MMHRVVGGRHVHARAAVPIVAVACEPSGFRTTVTHWDAAGISGGGDHPGIVPSMSRAGVGRFVKEVDVKRHQSR